MYRISRVFLQALILIPLLITSTAYAALTPLKEWDKDAVRKVLQTFAYGGFASDEQIKTWSKMFPSQAIEEMLTFNAVNEKVSPIEDGTALHGATLKSLQEFWSSNDLDNPVREDKRRLFPLLHTNVDGTTTSLSFPNLRNVWTYSVLTRGVNPFLHKTGMYLTNYHMAVHLRTMRPGLMRDFYDNAITSLSQGKNFFDVLAQGATSAAVARQYGHQYNRYVNSVSNPRFIGNDDFAREFHQLFFKIQGTTENQDYHENTTIEHTAWALTGMNIDQDELFYGSNSSADWFIPPIIFADHTDARGRVLQNQRWHYAGCPEILHEFICGNTAEEKIFTLAQIAGNHEESLVNLPAAVIDFFADDNLTEEEQLDISETWRSLPNKNFLELVRAYATSKMFHDEDTFKFRTAFDRNLIIQNHNTISNTELFIRSRTPEAQIRLEGAEVFHPLHDVFGGQTGLQAANNPNIFKEAFSRNVKDPGFLGTVEASYTDGTGVVHNWTKDWATVIPAKEGRYEAEYVAKWLWRRFVVNTDKEYYDRIARAQVLALLATGTDFGYVVDPLNPDAVYSTNDVKQLEDLIHDLKNSIVALDSLDPAARLEANRRMGLAVNFITATPFMFAQEGE